MKTQKPNRAQRREHMAQQIGRVISGGGRNAGKTIIIDSLSTFSEQRMRERLTEEGIEAIDAGLRRYLRA